MSSPWDGPDREVTVLRGEEHAIIGVHVSPPVGDDGRFSITFETSDRRSLCVRLPASQLQGLADVLHDLAALSVGAFMKRKNLKRKLRRKSGKPSFRKAEPVAVRSTSGLSYPVRGKLGRGNAKAMWREDMVVSKDEILSLIAWALGPNGPAELVEAFAIDEEPEAEDAISPEEKAATINKFSSTLLQLERQENSLISCAAADGFEIVRRPDANPMAVLNLVIVAREPQQQVA
jgi:hypothetical protein